MNTHCAYRFCLPPQAACPSWPPWLAPALEHMFADASPYGCAEKIKEQHHARYSARFVISSHTTFSAWLGSAGFCFVKIKLLLLGRDSPIV
jgi:hypothetical protein